MRGSRSLADAPKLAPKSLGELHDGVFQADKRGYDVHHIVERASARDDNYPDAVINWADNLVLIPRYRHWQINSWFETPNAIMAA